MDELAKTLGITEREGWYKVTHQKMADHGVPFLHKYNNSPSKLLQSIYSEYSWDIRKFGYVPHNYWREIPTQRKFMEEIAKKLNISKQTDWYRVTGNEVAKLGGSSLMKRYKGSLTRALQAIYPEYSWKFYRFYNQKDENMRSHSKTQQLLSARLKSLLPNVNQTYNFLHSSFQGKSNLQLDIFIPELSLAFEYNGEYHYKLVKIFNSANVQRRDERKRNICQHDGITLIVIPYWWDKTLESLALTIRNIRPDIKF